MKGSENFKSVIQKYLDDRAAQDSLFAQTLQKPNKSIDQCVDYILGEVQKSGINGFADDEIYGMAVHYYDEDDITVSKPSGGRVVVNQSLPADCNNSERGAAKKPAEKPAKPKKQTADNQKTNSLIPQSLFD